VRGAREIKRPRALLKASVTQITCVTASASQIDAALSRGFSRADRRVRRSGRSLEGHDSPHDTIKQQITRRLGDPNSRRNDCAFTLLAFRLAELAIGKRSGRPLIRAGE
jgi:hypothetical protein